MNPKAKRLLAAFMMTGCVAGCDADGDVAARPASGQILQPTTEPATNMKIILKLQNKTLTATLRDTPTARDFAAMLPLTLTLEDYSKTEKISDLPRKLTQEGAPEGADPSVGDIAYYAPWGNLALFHSDFGYSKGLIILGELDGGVEALTGPDPVKATIELAGENDRK